MSVAPQLQRFIPDYENVLKVMAALWVQAILCNQNDQNGKVILHTILL